VRPGSQATVASLDAFVRATLAMHWQQAAQLEHASVASFARFCLELMAIGAPPELLADAQAALGDEIDHARRCFALASSYAGVGLGPGPLQVRGATPADELETVIAAVIDEACIGETLAAVEATAALAGATEPAVRATLEVIAADETRHAELGWRTLRWALDHTDADTRERLLARLHDKLRQTEHDLQGGAPSPARATLAAHGMLDAPTRRDALVRGIREVLRPCVAALALARAA
jgi:hypothetical protein